MSFNIRANFKNVQIDTRTVIITTCQKRGVMLKKDMILEMTVCHVMRFNVKKGLCINKFAL